MVGAVAVTRAAAVVGLVERRSWAVAVGVEMRSMQLGRCRCGGRAEVACVQGWDGNVAPSSYNSSR